MADQSIYKMNLNEYMVTLEKPLGIRFALSVDGRIFVHSLRRGGNEGKSGLTGNSDMNSTMHTNYLRSLTGTSMQNLGASDLSRQLSMQAQFLQQNSIQFNAPKLPQQNQQLDQLSKV